jgi:hypothetical protein
MKLERIYLIRLIAVVAVLLMFVGCTFTLKSNDVSTLETGSPLRGIPPKTFAFKEFRDARGVVRGNLGNVLDVKKDPYLFDDGGPTQKYKLDQPPTSLVAVVIRKELERNGHRCIGHSAQSNPDFIIEGSVYAFQIRMSRTFDTEVAVKLTVTPVSPGKEVLIKAYEGKAPWKGGFWFKTSVNLALLAMVKEMSTDPDLIAFLEK